MMKKIKRNILLNPGPATTSDRVKLAQVVPDICPRESEFGDIMQYVSTSLTKLVANEEEYSTTLLGGSGTAAVESVLCSVMKESSTLLIINNGSYGERACEIAGTYDLDYINFKSSTLEAIDLNSLERVLKDNAGITHVFVVHNETTTGLLNSVRDIGALAKKYGVVLIVDGMSSFGAIPIDMVRDNISYLCASSNKNVQGMAGISFVIANKSQINKLSEIKSKSYYLNLYAQYDYFLENHQMRFTPPVQTLYALKEAIDELNDEGVENRYERYSRSWEILTTGLTRIGLKYLVDKSNHSKIITSVLLPENMNFMKVHDCLYDKGITIYPGKVDNLNTFRIANIGDIDSSDIRLFLCEFEKCISKI